MIELKDPQILAMPIISVLPLSSKCTLYYMLFDNNSMSPLIVYNVMRLQ